MGHQPLNLPAPMWRVQLIREGGASARVKRPQITSPGDMAGLLEFKSTLKRGDPFELVVRRDQGTKVLDGRMPGPESYFVFKRDVPSGLVRARYMANRIDIETSRVQALSILIHPDMVNLEEPLKITWNGRQVYQEKVKPDPAYMIQNFLEERDRNLIYIARVSLEYPG